VSFLGLISPVVAAAAGWLVLDQSLTGWQLLGVGLALGSLVAAQRTPTGRPRMPRATIGQTQMPSQMPSCPA